MPRPAAEPVIDIMVGVAGILSAHPCIELLRPLPCWYWPCPLKSCTGSPSHPPASPSPLPGGDRLAA
ncbi:hypothetical protein [Micromonospora psammae]|uniref:hypothetical protein n=1 Tax=Micromonospora sp. CPCC 205556 TaxID=3122398 RepID=UPI003FA55DD8